MALSNKERSVLRKEIQSGNGSDDTVKKLMDNPRNDDLVLIIERSREFRNGAAAKLLDRDPTGPQLFKVLVSENALQDRAAEALIRLGPTNADLCTIMKHSSAHRDDAWWLLTNYSPRPTQSQLAYVLEEVPEYAEQAKKIIQNLDDNKMALERIARNDDMPEHQQWATSELRKRYD